MNDKQLFALFMAQVLPAIQAVPGLSTVKMARDFQPRQHGANTAPYLYFTKLSDHRHGHPFRQDVYNSLTGDFVHEEFQQYESLFQFSAWIPQDPANTAGLTESDVLNVACAIMQSDTIIASFRAAGVGILRVTDVRNPYIVDERDQFAAIPNFDVALTYKRSLASTIPAVVAYDLNLSRV